jgi:hypothetical protein
VDWNEPVLLRYDFEAGPERAPALVRLGFPRHAHERVWTCAFQFQGAACGDELKEGHIYRVTGHPGLGALIKASNSIHSWLGRLVDHNPEAAAFEFVFPRFLPASWYALYSRANELVAYEVEQRGPSSRHLSPPAEQASHESLDGPALLYQWFEYDGRRKITVRLGFPTYVEGRRAWSCAFQLRGLPGNPVKRVFGANGLLAAAIAADFIRNALGEIGCKPSDKASYELSFPAHVPTEYGLELHRQLCDRIDAEIKQTKRKEDDRQDKRAAQFNEILATLPPSARL